MKGLLLSLGQLLGILLCAGGVVLALVTGLDPVWGGAGLLLALAGGGGAWLLRKRSGEDGTGQERSRRSEQAPAKPEHSRDGLIKRRDRGI